MKKFWTLYKKEFLETIRDKSVLISNFLIPLLTIPMIFLFTVMASGILLMSDPDEVIPKVNIYSNFKEIDGNFFKTDPTLKVDYHIHDFKNKDEVLNKNKENNKLGRNVYMFAEKTGSQIHLTIYTKMVDHSVFYQIGKINKMIQKYVQDLKDKRIKELKLTEEKLNPVVLTYSDNTEMMEVAKQNFSGQSGIIIVLFFIIGMYYPAINSILGEKDKKTMDVLILAVNSEKKIILAKLLNIFTFGLLTLIPYVIDFAIIKFFIKKHSSSQFALFTGENVGLFMMNLLVLGLVVAVLCLLISILCKTINRAQSFLSGFIFLLTFPAILISVRNKDMTVEMAFVPLMNFFFFMRDLILGKSSISIGVMTAIVNLIFFIIIYRHSVKKFSEKYVLKN